MTSNSGNNAFLQVDEGTIIGRQDGSPKPVFWIWKPQNIAKEYWVFFKYGDASGFHPPGSSHPNVQWKLEWKDEDFSDHCRFFQWVVDTFTVDPEDLSMKEHDITVVSCQEIANS